MSVISTVRKDTGGYAKKRRCSLDIHLMTVLSYSHVIIMDRAIILPIHVNNVVNGLNVTDKCDVK